MLTDYQILITVAIHETSRRIYLIKPKVKFANTSQTLRKLVTVILCNKSLKTNRISQWWFSHQGWITNKEDYYVIKTKKSVMNCTFWLELTQNDSNFWTCVCVVFCWNIQITVFDHLHWWTIFFSIRTCSVRYKYQSLSTGFWYKPWTGIHPYCPYQHG